MPTPCPFTAFFPFSLISLSLTVNTPDQAVELCPQSPLIPPSQVRQTYKEHHRRNAGWHPEFFRIVYLLGAPVGQVHLCAWVAMPM